MSNLESGTLYCGYAFNSFGNDKKWKESPWLLNHSSRESVSDMLIAELNKYIKLGGEKVNSLILSNESFSLQLKEIIPFLKYLQLNFELMIVFYIRSPESWSRSAYQQWAIKDKLNTGRIYSFEEYIETEPYRELLLEPLLVLKDNGLSNNLRVRNLEKLEEKNVLLDFTKLLNLPYQSLPRVNSSMSELEKAIYYVVNDSFEQRMSPELARRFVAKMESLGKSSEYFERVSENVKVFDTIHLLETKKQLNSFLPLSHNLEAEISEVTYTPSLEPEILGLIKYAFLHFMGDINNDVY